MNIKLIAVGKVKEEYYRKKIEELKSDINYVHKNRIEIIEVPDESIPVKQSTPVLEGIKNNPILQKEISIMQRQLLQAKDTIDFAQNKLNHESVADVGQICTISKIRIVHPVKKTDVLTNICLSPESMYKIEEKLHHLFFTGNS